MVLQLKKEWMKPAFEGRVHHPPRIVLGKNVNKQEQICIMHCSLIGAVIVH